MLNTVVVGGKPDRIISLASAALTGYSLFTVRKPMYATMFCIDLDEISSDRDRGRAGRSLATTLGVLRGFVAFIALEAGDGSIAGLCIVDDPTSLEAAHSLAAQWQREYSTQTGLSTLPIASGKVIAQLGF